MKYIVEYVHEIFKELVYIAFGSDEVNADNILVVMFAAAVIGFVLFWLLFDVRSGLFAAPIAVGITWFVLLLSLGLGER